MEKLKEEETNYKKIPVFREVSLQENMDNYFQLKHDEKGIIPVNN